MTDTYNKTHYPSIFNDVIGPVMRGPSSSHCAAALRIGRMVRDFMDNNLEEILIEFDPEGSLATTHESQGSDMGLFAGLLGWETTDARLVSSPAAIKEAGIKVNTKITKYSAEHPNTYKMTVKNLKEQHEITAVSTGGGIVEIIEIDGIKLSIAGDYYETIIKTESENSEVIEYLHKNIDYDKIITTSKADNHFIEIKAQNFLEKSVTAELNKNFNIIFTREITPILPVLSRRVVEVPFITCDELLKYNQTKHLELWELGMIYESSRGNMPEKEVFRKMSDIVNIMRMSIHEGIKGTEYNDRILGSQVKSFKSAMKSSRFLETGILNPIILYVTAMMEVKSSMGVIVAAPTAGACGGLPGACIGAADAMGLPVEDITKAMLAAGMIGVFIAAHATFAAETGGCQAECGAGSGMAAAGLVTLAKGTCSQAVHSSSMALQNILGMICDPVANRVEVPCLGKNVMAAGNALTSANMALAGFDPVIPLDEVIHTMHQVGKSLPPELRCTGLGGLSVTKSSKKIEKKLGRL